MLNVSLSTAVLLVSSVTLLTACSGASPANLNSTSLASEAGTATLRAKWRMGSNTQFESGDVLIGEIIDESGTGNSLKSLPYTAGWGPFFKAKTLQLNGKASAFILANTEASFSHPILNFTGGASPRYSYVFVVHLLPTSSSTPTFATLFTNGNETLGATNFFNTMVTVNGTSYSQISNIPVVAEKSYIIMLQTDGSIPDNNLKAELTVNGVVASLGTATTSSGVSTGSVNLYSGPMAFVYFAEARVYEGVMDATQKRNVLCNLGITYGVNQGNYCD